MAARNADHPPVGHGRPRYGPIKRLIKGWRYRPVKTSPALRFYNEVLGLDYLHYGLWDGDPAPERPFTYWRVFWREIRKCKLCEGQWGPVANFVLFHVFLYHRLSPSHDSIPDPGYGKSGLLLSAGD